MKKFLHIVLISLVSAGSGWAQNGHFTQFYTSGTHFNPAEAGSENNIRAIANYRRQWTTVAKGYTTQSFSLDAAGKYFSYGCLFSSDKAGAGSLKQNNALLTLAKHFKFNSANIVSLGIQAGLTQYSINPALLKFENQYNTDTGYDPTISNGENFSTNSAIVFGNSFGLIWKNTAGSWQPKFAASVKNLVKQEYTFLEINPEASSRLYNLYFEVNKKISSKVELIPNVYFQQQKKARETIIGLRVGYNINESQKIVAGAGMRNKDALLAYIGIPLKNVRLGFSYDLNTSRLKPATSGRGAWEISIVAGFKRKIRKSQAPELAEDKKQAMPVKDTLKPIVKTDTVKQELTDTSNHYEETKPPIHENTIEVKENAQAKDKIQHTSENRKEAILNEKNATTEMKKSNYLIYFDSDKSVIKPEYIILLNNMIQQVKYATSYRIIINGHTDIEGASAYNIELGEARANQVMTYCIEHGINMDMIKTCTYGKTSPIEAGADDKAKAKNRRVEIIVLTN